MGERWSCHRSSHVSSSFVAYSPDMAGNAAVVANYSWSWFLVTSVIIASFRTGLPIAVIAIVVVASGWMLSTAFLISATVIADTAIVTCLSGRRWSSMW